MKTRRRILHLVIAFVMLMSTFLPAVAFAQEPPATDLVIHKVVMDKLPEKALGGGLDGYDGTALANIKEFFGNQTAEELDGVTFTYWQVTEEQLATMQANSSAYDTVAKVTAAFAGIGNGTTTAPTANKQGVTVTNLPAGNYWFVENMGSNLGTGATISAAMAVPFGIELPMPKADGTTFTTGANALHVYPKNVVADKPLVDKDFEGLANAQNPRSDKAQETKYKRGDLVPYEIQTIIKPGAQYKQATWSDNMTEGLSFAVATANLKVQIAGADAIAADYTLTATDKGFQLALTDAGLAKINGKTTDTLVKITYSAVLNELAMSDVPERNDVIFHYGNNPGHGNAPIPIKPANGQISVDKTWADAAGGALRAPDGVTVTFTLYNAQTGAVVEAKQWTGTTVVFTGLNADTEYKVVESAISGYSAEYSLGLEGGVIAVKNFKDDNPDAINPAEPQVIVGGHHFLKVDSYREPAVEGGTEGNVPKPLQHARFVIQNNNDGSADQGKYLALKSDVQATTELNTYNAAETAYQNAVKAMTQSDLADTVKVQNLVTLKEARDNAFTALKSQYTYVDAIDAALRFTSDANGAFEVQGIAYGRYNLIEVVAPTGYALKKIPDSFIVFFGSGSGVGSSDAGPTAIEPLDIVNTKLRIPQAGGIGSVIFVLAGVGIMGTTLAVYKKRKQADNA